MRTTWDRFKSFLDSRGLAAHEVELDDNNYLVETFDGPLVRSCKLREGSAEYTDYITNYQPNSNKVINPINPDNRTMVHQTSRQRGQTTYFTSAGDDSSDPLAAGGSSNVNEWFGKHSIGESTLQSYYLDLNLADNQTCLHEGYLQWKDALNDAINLEIVPKVTTTSAGSNTLYNTVNGYLIVPAAGDGTTVVQDADRVLVEVPLNEYGKKAGQGFWDATFNTTTKVYENITANGTGTGQFNMFSVEVVLDRFANRVRLLGSGFMQLQTSDAQMIGDGMRLKLTTITEGADHDWYFNAMMTIHRKRTT